MQILKHSTVEEFLKYNEKLLLKNESFYNVLLGSAYSLRNGKIEATGSLFYSILENEKIIGCALRSSLSKPLSITQMPSEAVKLLIQE